VYADDPPPECFKCLELENKLDDVAYWLRGLLDQLYGIEEFNLSLIEHHLAELAHTAKMTIPNRDLAIRAKDETSTMLDSWKIYNNGYLKSLGV
jgi:hypothetical protein